MINYPDFDAKSEIRNLKLKLINGSYNFSIKPHKIGICRKELEFISNKFPDDIITGSLAFKLYGLIDRNIGDIDLIIKDRDRFSSYNNSGYDEESGITNRLGSRWFDYKPKSENRILNLFNILDIFRKSQSLLVDFFENNESNYIEFEFCGKMLKIQKPIELLDTKLLLMENSSNQKHRKDIYHIFSQISLSEIVYC